MSEITVSANAKINVSLQITGKRADGYHELRSVMNEIGLSDVLHIACWEGEESRLSLSCGDPGVPTDHHNTISKAFAEFIEKTGIKIHCRVDLEKRIPSGAGLGGGSSDAAAFLKAINLLTQSGLTQKELSSLAERVGADVPFCIYGGTAVVRGIGEIVEPVRKLQSLPMVLVKPDVSLSTPEVYAKYDQLSGKTDPEKYEKCVSAARQNQTLDCVRMAQNDLSFPSERICPEITEIKQELRSLGAVASEMTGSGSAVFGIFIDEDQAEHAFRTMRETACFCCRTCL